MNVLHVIASMDPRHGGVSEAVRQLAEMSITLGCHVEVATLDIPGQAFLADFPFSVHALGPGRTHFQYCPKLRDWLLANISHYDVVVIHALWQYHSIAVREAALKQKVPYVVYTHGMLDPYFKRAHPLKHAKKWLFWPWGDYRVLRDAKAVLFTTEEECRLARQSFWLYSAREVIAHLGTSGPTVNTEDQRSAFLSLYPVLKNRRLALFLGRIHPKKGCDLAIEAFARVLAADPDWHLVMAGPDQIGWQKDLEQKAANLGIAQRVTWTGMLQGAQKWGALRAAEFFFLPSHQENFGVVVAEALACGTPVLISDKVNIWREIEAEGAGLVAPDTIKGASDLLRTWILLASDGQARLRTGAVPCFEKRFEIGRATAKLLETLKAHTAIERRAEDLVSA